MRVVGSVFFSDGIDLSLKNTRETEKTQNLKNV